MTRAAKTRRHAPRPNNDIEALAQKVPGFAPHRYVDEQEAQAASTAAARWPRLAGWLGYADGTSDGTSDGLPIVDPDNAPEIDRATDRQIGR